MTNKKNCKVRFCKRIEFLAMIFLFTVVSAFAQSAKFDVNNVAISADLMNILYAGIDNPVSIAVSGVPQTDIDISVTNATAIRTERGWNIHPVKVDEESVVTVSALIDGKKVDIGSKSFRVKRMPSPLAKLEYIDELFGKLKFSGGTIAKNYLETATRIVVDLGNGYECLDIEYDVSSFNLVHFDSEGNTLVEISNGAELTERQLNILKNMKEGKTVYITNVKAKGPDDITRVMPPIEIVLK